MSSNYYKEVDEFFEADKRPFEITHNVLVFLICVVGIPGNMISFGVLSRPEFKSSVNCCLQFLSVFDALFLCFYLVVAIAIVVPHWILICLYASVQGSMWTTMFVSLERFIAVCYPLKARFLCTYKKTLLCNIVTVIVSISLNVPRIFTSENYEANENVPLYLFFNTRYKSERNTLKIDRYYMTDEEIYLAKAFSWMEITLLYFLPMLAIICFNIRIYLAIKDAERRRREISQSQQKEINIAKTVLVVVVVFVITGSPWLVFKIVTHYGLVSLLQYINLLYMLNPLAASNSAANFMIYFAVNRDFRRTLVTALKNFRVTVQTFAIALVSRKRKAPEVYIIENTKL